MLPVNQVLVGDCIEVMKGFPAESIDMAMFSPPYWGLRDYGVGTETVWGGSSPCEHEWVEEACGLVHENRNNLRGSQEEVVGKTGTAWIRKYDQKTVGFCVKCGAWRGQLGLESNFQMYVDHMVEVCREIERVLKKTGNMYIVLGDTFMNKHKLGIPWRIRFALNEDGWISRDDIVWHKPNSMPSSMRDRLAQTYEYIFHFVRNTGKPLLWRNELTGEWVKEKPKQQYYRAELAPFNLRVRDVKRGKAGVSAFGELRASSKEIEEYAYPEKTKDAKDCLEDIEIREDKPLKEERRYWRPLWRGFNYYYELDQIREPHTSLKDLGRKRLDTRTPKHDLAVKLGAGRIGPSGYLVQHPLGKNPGDIVQTKLEGLGIQDLIREVYRRLSRNDETYEGKNRLDDVNAKRIRAFDGRKIREAARQVLSERQIPHSTKLVEFIHDHFSHPLGKNPGDTIRCRTDRRLIRDRPLRPPHHPFRGDGWEGTNPDMQPHPKGKNPGDVIHEKTWQRAEEYHRRQGKLRSNGTIAGHYLDLSDVARHYNPRGKNPGDIVKIAEEKGRPLSPPHHPQRTRASDIDRMVSSGGFYHEYGKNPGDVIENFSGILNEVMKIYAAVTNVEVQEWEGKTSALDPQHNFRRLAQNERKSRVRFEIALDKLGIQDDLRRKLIAYWHNHSTHSLGKNPGDIIKLGMHHGSSLTSGRATHHDGQVIESHPSGSNPGDFWSINTKPFKGAHFAVYPEEICVKPILSSCPANGIVLDPMCGSGTTLAVAKKLGRRYIGIDLNPNYVNIAIERLLKIGSFDHCVSG